jgi:NitT/TauT family transport system substrate-binding protein
LKAKKIISAITLILVFSSVTACKKAETNSGLIPVRLQLDWYPQPEQGGYFAAQELGYYKAEGLDVTIEPMPQYGSTAQVVATGKADIGLGSGDQILEWNSNGLPLVAVMATMQHELQAVMVHEESPVHNFSDLEDRTVAAQTGATWLKYVTAKYKLKNVKQIPATHSIANFLADPNYIQQIFVTSEPFYATEAGAKVRSLPISSSGYDPYRVAFTSRDFLAQHPDVLARFVRASIRGWNSYLADPTRTNTYLLKLNPALNPAQEAYTVKALSEGGLVAGSDKAHPATGQMDAARWQSTYEQLKSLGVLHSEIDPKTTYTTQFLH